MGDVLVWVLIAAGVLAGVLVLLTVIGIFLPRTRVVARALKTSQPPRETASGLAGWASAVIFHWSSKILSRN